MAARMAGSRCTRVGAVAFGWMLVALSARAQDPATLDRVAELLAARNIARADSLAEWYLQSLLSSASADSGSIADALHAAVQTKITAGQGGNPQTMHWALRALAIRERLGSETELAKATGQLARLYRDRGEFQEAKPFAERELLLTERVHGAESLEAAQAHNSLGAVVFRMGDVARARQAFGRTLEIRQLHLDANDAEIASSYQNLAATYLQESDFTAAEPLLQRALEIRRAALGQDHPLYAQTLGTIAVVLLERGESRQALPMLEQAFDINERVYGPEHPRLADSLLELARALEAEQRLGEAQRTLERSIAILEKAYGPDNSHLVYPLDDLADLHYVLGNTEAAIQTAERGLRIVEVALGAEHPQVAAILTDLAEYHRDRGEFEKARGILLRSREIQVAAAGEDSPEVAHGDMYLADILREEGRVDEAIPLYMAAAAKWVRTYGTEHRLVAAALMGLARCRIELRQFDFAEETLRDVLAIREKVLGSEHRYVASVHYEQARLFALRRETAKAMEKALLAEQIGRSELRQTIRDLSQQPSLQYAQDREAGAGLNIALSLAVAGRPSQAMLRRTWDAWIDARAFVLDEMALRRQALHEMSDSKIRELRTEWAAASGEVARQAVGSAEPSDDTALRRKADLEDQLAAASASFQRQRHRRAIRLADVEATLPHATVLVSYVQYLDFNSGHPRYAALLRDLQGTLHAVDLGDASAMDQSIAAWRQAMQLASVQRSPLEASSRRAGESLRSAMWDPLRDYLGKAKQVFLVPDANLALVNPTALPIGDRSFLIEGPLLVHTLSAERDLVVEEPSAVAAQEPEMLWLAFADPDFDAASSNPSTDAPVEVAYRGSRSDCASFDALHFGPLPISAKEVDSIRSFWPPQSSVRVVTGANASEAAFKALAPRAKTLHLATHGFFLGSNLFSGLTGAGQRGVGGMRPSADAPICNEGNPLLLSGLALAGANARSSSKRGLEDGVLTAEEIATLDLSRTEWAVLSACETGLGEVRAGEGILGLRRAFRLAGVRTLVMSLWAVEDEAARAWMTSFYSTRVGDGRTSAEAVRSATLAALERSRSSGNAHPFFWAPFVVSGDWR